MPENPPLFFAAQLDKILEYYQQVIVDLVYSEGLCGDILISEKALSYALVDADKDVVSICARRVDTFTISKVSGILLFRLARSNIVHLPESMLRNKVALSLNQTVALAVVLSKMSGLPINMIDKINPDLLLELQFTLEKRHMNQETLAICIEAIRSAVEK